MAWSSTRRFRTNVSRILISTQVDTYEKYDRGGRPPHQKQVEAHLASVLKEKGVSVKCDTSIKYTIVR